jgi:hypothetical protein
LVGSSLLEKHENLLFSNQENLNINPNEEPRRSRRLAHRKNSLVKEDSRSNSGPR